MATDDISYKIGHLTSMVEILVDRSEKHESATDRIESDIGELKRSMKTTTEEVAELKPDVEHYRGVRKNAAWVGSGLVASSGIIGALIQRWVDRWF